MTARPIATDPDTGIPDLVRRLTEDSKRLVTDEVHLAKLEAKDSLSRAAKGGMWLVVAFGVGVVMLVALTLFLSTLIGRIVNGHMWLGALVTGLLELGVGAWLIMRGGKAYGGGSYTLEESRHALKDTAGWVSDQRRG